MVLKHPRLMIQSYLLQMKTFLFANADLVIRTVRIYKYTIHSQKIIHSCKVNATQFTNFIGQNFTNVYTEVCPQILWISLPLNSIIILSLVG